MKEKHTTTIKKKVDVDVNFLFSTSFVLIMIYTSHGDYMKNIVKSLIMPLVLAILIGVTLGLNFYKTYQNNLEHDLRSRKLYLIENGEYDNIDKMREANLGNNYVYYKIGNKYKSVIAITNTYDNINKIKDLYDDNFEITEYYIGIDLMDDKQYEYDKLLSQASNPTEVKEAIDNILKLYQNDNNLKLITIS